jgi:hypothetical protein
METRRGTRGAGYEEAWEEKMSTSETFILNYF